MAGDVSPSDAGTSLWPASQENVIGPTEGSLLVSQYWFDSIGARDLKMCEKCGSTNESELDSEICIHFSGKESLNAPVLFVFPKLSVCLECGRSEFILAKTELEQLRRDVSQARLRLAGSGDAPRTNSR